MNDEEWWVESHLQKAASEWRKRRGEDITGDAELVDDYLRPALVQRFRSPTLPVELDAGLNRSELVAMVDRARERRTQVCLDELYSSTLDNFELLDDLKDAAKARAEDAARAIELLGALEFNQHQHTDQLSRITALVERNVQFATELDAGALVLNRALVAWALWLFYCAFAVYMQR